MTITLRHLLTTAMPSLAPLPSPMARHLFLNFYRKEQHGSPIPQEDTQLPMETVERFVERIHHARLAIHEYIEPYLETGQYGNELLAEIIFLHSPPNKKKKLANNKLAESTLSRWRSCNLLQVMSRTHPENLKEKLPTFASFSWMSVARLVDKERSDQWFVPTLLPDEPWWCWRQDTPQSPIIPCPVPLPDNLPPAALLWTIWPGAALKPPGYFFWGWEEKLEWMKRNEWMLLDEYIGAIRFAGITNKKGPNQSACWNVSLRDLKMWDNRTAEAMTKGFAYPENKPGLLQNVADYLLRRVGEQRLQPLWLCPWNGIQD